MQNFRNSLAIAALLLGVASASAQITPPRASLGANAFTGQQSVTTNGAASTPPLLLNGSIFTGGTGTTTRPQLLIEPSGTSSTAWNVNGTLLGINAPSGFVGNLIDAQQNGVTVYTVRYDGFFTTFGFLSQGNAGVGYQNIGVFSAGPGGSYGLGSNPNANDTIWSRKAAGNWRMGAADVAAPVAQTLSVQGVVAGTSNTAGPDFAFTASQGTGTGAGGGIRLKVAPAGTTGTAQNALADAVVIDSTKLATFSGHTASTGTAPALSACGTTPTIVGTDTKGAITAGTGVVTACTATFATAYTAIPVCVANSNTTGAFVAVITVTTSTITFGTSATIAGGVIYYHCMQ